MVSVFWNTSWHKNAMSSNQLVWLDFHQIEVHFDFEKNKSDRLMSEVMKRLSGKITKYFVHTAEFAFHCLFQCILMLLVLVMFATQLSHFFSPCCVSSTPPLWPRVPCIFVSFCLSCFPQSCALPVSSSFHHCVCAHYATAALSVREKHPPVQVAQLSGLQVIWGFWCAASKFSSALIHWSC